MDDKWIYGSRPEQIYSDIVQGRPNGMPSLRRQDTRLPGVGARRIRALHERSAAVRRRAVALRRDARRQGRAGRKDRRPPDEFDRSPAGGRSNDHADPSRSPCSLSRVSRRTRLAQSGRPRLQQIEQSSPSSSGSPRSSTSSSWLCSSSPSRASTTRWRRFPTPSSPPGVRPLRDSRRRRGHERNCAPDFRHDGRLAFSPAAPLAAWARAEPAHDRSLRPPVVVGGALPQRS